MFASATPATPSAAPTGARADGLTPSHLLILFIVRLFILWAQDLADSLRERTETTDLTAVMRAFGTTDVALILERVTCGLQRLRALEAKILRHAAGLGPDPQGKPPRTAACPCCPAAPQPPTPEQVAAAVRRQSIGAAPICATGPPPTPGATRKTPTGPVHPLPPRGMAGPVVPIPLPWRGTRFD